MYRATLFLLFSAFASADTGSNSKLALARASEAAQVWQTMLELKHWTITIRVVRVNELKPKTYGNINWDSDAMTAIIRVMDPADYELSLEEALRDIEVTVVHELIHLKWSPVLAPLPRNDANRKKEESVVNNFVDVLLKLKAKADGTPQK